MAIKIQGTTVIDKEGNSIVLENINGANVSAFSLNGSNITASAAELSTLDGITSSPQTQLNNIEFTLGSLSKSFANGESANISLNREVVAPIVNALIDVPENEGNVEYIYPYEKDQVIDVTDDISTALYQNLSFLITEESNIYDVAFNNDGTKMFIVGSANDTVYQYSLSTAYEISTASYDSVSFSVASQESAATSLKFNTDGTKMFIGGFGSASAIVYQYSLSTGFDVSTASYDSVSFDASAGSSNPGTSVISLAFNNDGTKMFIGGNNNGDTLWQYSLSTGFDLSTASDDNTDYDTGGGASIAGIAFNSDGSKMYVAFGSRDYVLQYNLSIEFDLSTAAPAASSDLTLNVYDYSIRDVRSITFSNDGSKMFIASGSTVTVHQFDTSKYSLNANTELFDRHNTAYNADLSFNITGFDLLTAVYNSENFDVSAASTNGRIFEEGLNFNNDGTKMFVMGGNGNTNGNLIYQYSLSNAFDVTTASFDNVTTASNTQQSAPEAFRFNDDGYKMYILGPLQNASIFQYSLSAPFAINTKSYDSVSINTSGRDAQPQDMVFNNDGTKLYTLGIQTDSVHQWTLSTAFNLATISYDNVTFSVASQEASPYAMAFNNDGTKMYIAGSGTYAHQYNLSTAYDISTASYDITGSVSVSNTRSLYFNNSGTRMFALRYNTDNVYQYDLDVIDIELQLSSGSFANTDVGKRIEANTGVLVVSSSSGNAKVVEGFESFDTIPAGEWEMYSSILKDGTITLDTSNLGFVLEKASYASRTITVASTPSEVIFNDDGTVVYVVNYLSSNNLYQYNLGVPFDINTRNGSTASYIFNSGISSYMRSAAFNNDGTKLYMLSDNPDLVYQFSLSTAFDLSTASYDSVSFAISEDGTPAGIKFNNDGTKMYIAGAANDSIYQYSLSTAFDLSTASYDSVSFAISEDGTPAGIKFNSDGTKMFVLGAVNDTIFQYSLSTAFNLSTAYYDNVSFLLIDAQTPLGFAFSNDGTQMFVTDDLNGRIYEYSTREPIPSQQYSINITNANGQINTSGDIPWTAINSMTVSENSTGYYAISTDNRNTWKIAKGAIGERNIVRNNSGTWQYANANTGVGNDISNAIYDDINFSVSAQNSNPGYLVFNNNGTKMYILSRGGSGSQRIYQYSLSTGFDVSTASYDSVSFDATSQDSDPIAIAFNNDGTKMYMLGLNADTIYQYSLSTGFDVSTASYDSVSFSVNSQDSQPYSIAFNNDGTKMYMLGNAIDSVYQYSLSTAYDISTASYDSVSFFLPFSPIYLRVVGFNVDGTKMYVADRAFSSGNFNSTVYQYSLSTGFDLSTVSDDNINFRVASQESAMEGLAFNDDYSKMYVVGNSSDRVHQYTLYDYESEIWTNASINNEFTALQEALETTHVNHMTKTTLRVTNSFTPADSLDLMVALYSDTQYAASIPSFTTFGLNYTTPQTFIGAELGSDYDFTFSNSNTVSITSNENQILNIRVI